MTATARLLRATNALPIYVIFNTTPWPLLSDNTEWVELSFDVEFTTFDEVARGVTMHVPVHVTRHRRTARRLDPRNPTEHEFEGDATFDDDRVVPVHGTINIDKGMGSFDDMSS